MVDRKLVDMKRLWDLTQQGKSADEIMRELHISEIGTLQNAVQNLVHEKGVTINVPGLIGKGSIGETYTDKGDRIPQEMPKHK